MQEIRKDQMLRKSKQIGLLPSATNIPRFPLRDGEAGIGEVNKDAASGRDSNKLLLLLHLILEDVLLKVMGYLGEGTVTGTAKPEPRGRPLLAGSGFVA